MSQQLDEKNTKELLKNTDAFLFDCDGVLWDPAGVIPGSPEAIAKLKEMGKKVFYVTNNSSKSRDVLLEKCRNLGFEAKKEEVVGTAYIAAAYLKQRGFKGKVYLIGHEDSLGQELDNVGIPYIGPGPDPTPGFDLSTWLTTELDPEVGCVLVGFDCHLSYNKLIKAASYLKNPDCLFLATNLDTNLPVKGDITIPGTGCMIVPVAHAARRQPTVLGKPETLMFEVLQKAEGLDPSRCLMTGDMLSTDMKFAENCGIRSLLVLSGNTALEDLGKPDCPATPTHHTATLGDILRYA